MTPIPDSHRLLWRRLQTLSPLKLRLQDRTHLHRRHAEGGAGGHFYVQIVSDKFRGLSALARQRMVYAAVGDLQTLRVHALPMQTLTPEENIQQKEPL